MEIFTSASKSLAVFLLGISTLTFARPPHHNGVVPMHAKMVAGPEVQVLGNYQSIANNDVSPSVSDNTNIGSVSIESGSTTVIYTIQNTGDADLTLGAVTISGSDAALFTVVQQPASTVAAGGQTTLHISFQPTTIGTKTVQVSFTSNDSDESNFSFAISGLGVRTYPDTDGDGISDNIDIDDDNDGIPDVDEQLSCFDSPFSGTPEYIFLNETFGAGTTKGQININIPGATCTYCYEDGIVGTNTAECPSQSSRILDDGEYVVTHKIAGTDSADPDNIHGDLAWNGPEDHTPGDVNGRMAVFNASFTPGIFYETTIHGVIPNIPVTYGFWALNIMSVGNYGGSILPNITVEFLDMENNLISSFNTGDIGRCGTDNADNSCTLSQWRQYTTSVNLGDNTSFVIRFRNNAPGGGGNDLALDDITIRQNYCDRDSDGIANIFDLDSDNDGIPDVEEAGFKNFTTGNAMLDVAAGSWVDVNANGLHDTIEAMLASGYTFPDSDGDGVPDFQDLDSDNDSLFDVDEAGMYNGDGDIDGDGTGDGLDSDHDGLLDVFDTFIGFGSDVRDFAQDFDGDGQADYTQIDIDSDGVFDIAQSIYASLDANGDGEIDGTADVDKDGIIDSFDSDETKLGSPRDIDTKLYLDLDGRNDYAEGSALLGNLPEATIMGWVKLANGFAVDGYIFGQDNFNVKMTGSGEFVASANGQQISFSDGIQTDRWYHVAAVYNPTSETKKLAFFLNGQEVSSSNDSSLSGALNASTTPFTIGKNAASPSDFFEGSVDEVRVFNKALSEDQLHKIVYQEIDKNGTAIRGSFVPKDVESLDWSSLVAYYRMDTYKDDVCDDRTTSTVDQGAASGLLRIYNVKKIRPQLAPMPFVTTLDGSLDNAVSQQNFVNGQDVFDYEWAMVHIKNNIDLPVNHTSLGMVIDSGKLVRAVNNNKIRNDWYLKLDGKIDLVDRAQLHQSDFSDLDVTSAGSIERDQQGTTNKFNYNYWCSPVGAVSATQNNPAFTVSGVLRDGTDASNPQAINWIMGINPTPTSPITLSSYWIFKFQNLSNSYSNWGNVGANGTLLAGQGFTLKGSSVPAESQNLVFTGKPNNGEIQMPIAANNLNLAGNPYPSAMDANKFIEDNLGSVVGTLYFWEHYSTNNTHVTQDYQGGYAVRTLVGGLPPVAPPGVSGYGSSSHVPNRFIPVGQGFFVRANNTGGNIKFDNTQRVFVKEGNADSGPMFRTNQTAEQMPAVASNADDVFEQDTHPRIRIGFDFVNQYHRQLLLGYMGSPATGNFDSGYDASNNDTNPDDLTFKLGYYRCVIMGEGNFDVTKSFPLEVKSQTAGQVRFTLDGTENFDSEQPIYIYDALLESYVNLRNADYNVSVNQGLTTDRFYLKYTAPAWLSTGDNASAGITVMTASDGSYIGIKNSVATRQIQKVELFTVLGQKLSVLETKSMDQSDIRMPSAGLSSGTYVAKITTDSGEFSRKIIIE
ncbi:LamG-like jellyroll fold domain-containing protein [Flavobacterium silvaticum]|uniref:Choice-of-anchor D domain-containing protein n=1 Tax=Flavobacterium silvaticum TaxID=1852020 RepID=A0A972FU48_9FLAO|nr:LamG-like jellyroll fold domain-containing protein [Flavobacterium silvaticum]NMH28072.1 choice-of-anchor D domain-containing protein [Flavobacterium silvaticum]